MPAPQPTSTDWHDLPATPGEWSWRREGRLSVAGFVGAPGVPLLSLTCDPQASTVTLRRAEAAGGASSLAIETTSLSRVLAAAPGSDGGIAVTLRARDPLLDAMAFSRGRFAVEVPGLEPLYLPSWPEVSRVIEDCRQGPATSG